MDCPSCSMKLKEPYINCVECEPNVQICLRCFAKGIEFDKHTNDHTYEIKKLSFPLFDDKWTARDELQLLDELEDNGFGNWQGISNRLKDKNAKDVQQHFLKNYVEDPQPPLPKFTQKTKQFWRRPIEFKESTHPPRPGCSNAEDELFLIGYMPARGDFIVEPDNFAESDLKDVEFHQSLDEPDELMTEMNHNIVDMYYLRQRERNMKKSIVKRYGLHDAATSSLFYTYGRDERMVRDFVKKFARLIHPEWHEKFIQGLLYQKSLESKIEHLQEYRRSGLRSMKDAVFYEKQKRRKLRMKKLRAFKLDEVLLQEENPFACQVWLQRQLNRKKNFNSQMPNLNRKPISPLDLTGLPGTESLTDEEKSLCSTVRMTPNDYLEYRVTLQEESFRSNGIKLQTARNLLKIDVNRTKKVHEFLVRSGQIKEIKSSPLACFSDARNRIDF